MLVVAAVSVGGLGQLAPASGQEVPTVPPVLTVVETTTIPPPVTELPTTTAPVTTLPPIPTVTTIAPTIAPTTVPPSTVAQPLSTLPGVSSTVPIVALPGETTTIAPLATTIDPNATTTIPGLPVDLLPEGPFAEPPPPFSLAPTTAPPVTFDVSGQNLQEGPTEATPNRIPIPDAPYTAPISSQSFSQVLAALTSQQRSKVLAAQARADEATARVNAAQEALNALNEQRDKVLTDVAKLELRRSDTVKKMQRRALRLYTGDSTEMLAVMVGAQNPADLSRRTDLVSQAQMSDSNLVKSFRSEKLDLSKKNEALEDIAGDRRVELLALQEQQKVVDEELRVVAEQLKLVEDGASVSFNGYAFPVQLPVSYVDTYGAPRMTGTKYYHWHQGVDIFAPMGTPIRAVERGIVHTIGVRPLGGNRLWVQAASNGTQYYYAHLSAYAPNIVAGSVVETGQIIGFVGDTGNAKGTPAHLHFEIHPDQSGPINPNPILKAIENSDAEAFIKATQPSLPSVISGAATTVPGATTTPALGGAPAGAAGAGAAGAGAASGGATATTIKFPTAATAPPAPGATTTAPEGPLPTRQLPPKPSGPTPSTTKP
jgi:murein DD-endopeptidase MepM/ murein hydrolase activator NlpD